MEQGDNAVRPTQKVRHEPPLAFLPSGCVSVIMMLALFDLLWVVICGLLPFFGIPDFIRTSPLESDRVFGYSRIELSAAIALVVTILIVVVFAITQYFRGRGKAKS